MSNWIWHVILLVGYYTPVCKEQIEMCKRKTEPVKTAFALIKLSVIFQHMFMGTLYDGLVRRSIVWHWH